MLRILLLGLLSFVSAQNSVSVTNCNPSSVFQITNHGFEPSNPVPGQNGTFIINYNVPNEVIAGTVNYKCNYNGLPVYNEVPSSATYKHTQRVCL